MPLTEVGFEGVRCFRDKVTVPLAPLTLLVGENSTGKTTCLALVRLIWDLLLAPDARFDFNERPFPLGAYDQIATLRGGRGGLARKFHLHGTLRPESRGSGSQAAARLKFRGRFVAGDGQPSLEAWTLGSGHGALSVTRLKSAWELQVATAGGSRTWSAPPGSSALHPRRVAELDRDVAEILQPLAGLRARDRRPYAFAPIRTQPLRTYDPVTESPEPEGSHVPMLLARLRTTDAKAWESLRASLSDFGRESGLFEVVEVQRKGRKESDPFQIRVKVEGPAFNIVDVGYGVSQVLPLLVDCQRAPRGGTFLLQQPEVHLHPRAQAALGTWLGTSAKLQGKRYIVETHSDHLLDRVRMDVRDGRHLAPADVAILYFERNKGIVSVTRLELNTQGDFVNAPSSYRSFFLEEERRLLLGPKAAR